jgi:DNA-binding response OmpR family regulator
MIGTVQDLTGRRVLVVEDESRIAMLVHDFLEEMGCEVVGMASRLEDGFQKATSLSFDIAVLDINLNGQCSYPIARALLARGRAFVFATAYESSQLPAALHDTPLVRKPFVFGELQATLRAALVRH